MNEEKFLDEFCNRILFEFQDDSTRKEIIDLCNSYGIENPWVVFGDNGTCEILSNGKRFLYVSPSGYEFSENLH